LYYSLTASAQYVATHGDMFENLSPTFWTDILQKLQESYIGTSPFAAGAAATASTTLPPTPASPTLSRQFLTVSNFLTNYMKNFPAPAQPAVREPTVNSLEELNTLAARSLPGFAEVGRDNPEFQRALQEGAKIYFQSMSLESISQLFTSMLHKK